MRHILPKPLRLISNIIRSPYFFSFKELLWNHNRYINWSYPSLNILSQKNGWLELEVGGLRFFWPDKYDTAGLPWLYHEIFTPAEDNLAAYEAESVKIKEGEWVIDAGASEGFFTAYALTKGANVLAIEPVRLLCDALQLTFENEVRLGRLRILHGCLGKNNDLVKIKVDPKSVFSSVTGTQFGESVHMYTLDSIVSEGIIPNVAFIKMDIEGAEIDALKGSIRTLEKFKPNLAIAVYHELYNAKLSKQIICKARPDYRIKFRGIYNWDGCILRPHMLLAY